MRSEKGLRGKQPCQPQATEIWSYQCASLWGRQKLAALELAALSEAAQSLLGSYPHLLSEQQRELERHLLGFLTSTHFALPVDCLLERADSVAIWVMDVHEFLAVRPILVIQPPKNRTVPLEARPRGARFSLRWRAVHCADSA